MIKELWTLKEEVVVLDIVSGKIDQIIRKNICKKSFRLFHHGLIYQSSGLGHLSEHQLEKMALDQEDTAQKYTHPLPPAKKGLWDTKMNDLNFKRLYDALDLAIEKFNLAKKLFLLNGKVHFINRERSITRNDGLHLVQNSFITEGGIAFKDRKVSNIIDAYLSFSQLNGFELSECFQTLSPFWSKWNSVQKVKPGKRTICFLTFDSHPFSLFLRSLNPETYFSGATIYQNKLSQNIFHQDLNLMDYSHQQDLATFIPFDDEGTLRPMNQAIIKNGQWNNLISDCRTAHQYQLPLTANARRTYDSPVLPNPWGYGFEPTGPEFYQMNERFDEVIVVLMAVGGDVTSSGDFSTPVQLGFLVKNGKVEARLEPFTVLGNIQDYMTHDFKAVAAGNPFKGSPHPVYIDLQTI
jgi:PmbA protein